MALDTHKAYQIATILQMRIANAGPGQATLVTAPRALRLQAQLQSPTQPNPAGVGALFTGVPDLLDFADILAHGDAFRGLPGDPLGKAVAFLKAVLSAQTPQDLLQNVQKAIAELATCTPIQDLALLPAFMKGQLSVALSVASIVAKLPSPAVAQAIEAAYIAYLFDEKGFQTIDGDSVAPPTHLSSLVTGALEADLKRLKDAVAEKNAVRYIRDLVRVPVEAACDAAYQLSSQLTTKVTSLFPEAGTQGAGRAKVLRWMKGFASMAEAAVTGAVEEVCAGAGSFQTNPLVAAAAGTFCGTWARKMTQEAFLQEI